MIVALLFLSSILLLAWVIASSLSNNKDLPDASDFANEPVFADGLKFHSMLCFRRWRWIVKKVIHNKPKLRPRRSLNRFLKRNGVTHSDFYETE